LSLAGPGEWTTDAAWGTVAVGTLTVCVMSRFLPVRGPRTRRSVRSDSESLVMQTWCKQWKARSYMAQQLTTDILNAALENLTSKRQQIGEQIAEVRRMLGSRAN